MDICPKLMNGVRIVDYKEGYCKNYKPIHLKECEYLKIFIVKDYINSRLHNKLRQVVPALRAKP
ncbi:hypothetical protein FIU95_04205 [Microbulbifer sp. THAF38]|nr:hypothetical protein FIU95_04205 [Microbulbifer sp. THAF38]